MKKLPLPPLWILLAVLVISNYLTSCKSSRKSQKHPDVPGYLTTRIPEDFKYRYPDDHLGQEQGYDLPLITTDTGQGLRLSDSTLLYYSLSGVYKVDTIASILIVIDTSLQNVIKGIHNTLSPDQWIVYNRSVYWLEGYTLRTNSMWIADKPEYLNLDKKPLNQGLVVLMNFPVK